jgi:hypothetical protein
VEELLEHGDDGGEAGTLFVLLGVSQVGGEDNLRSSVQKITESRKRLDDAFVRTLLDLVLAVDKLHGDVVINADKNGLIFV